jgi:predicted aspartyl protease
VSIKIDLEFETKLDSELLSVGISTRLIRLISSLRLKTSKAWTDPYKAIIDTGSPITLIPKHVWEKVSIKRISPTPIKLLGLGSGTVSGKLAQVLIIFLDKERLSPPISLKALLVDSDTVPLIIGFEDVLTDIKLVCDYTTKTASLQILS